MFLFLTVVLAPVLAVAIVGGWGFVVWIYQTIYGPPGPQAARTALPFRRIHAPP